MGQFLGYSSEHSSQIGLVCHLKTGHISPQWHLVFDGKFETVYCSGQPTPEVDQICNNLFDSSREEFAEEEFDEEGGLIYKPPPLDDVWLTPEERKERRTDLTSQKVRAAARDKARAKLEPIDAELPDDEESSVFLDDAVDTASEGDEAADTASEGDMWVDHRTVRPPDIPPPPPVMPPGDALGRGPDGRSRRLACVNGPKQLPKYV